MCDKDKCKNLGKTYVYPAVFPAVGYVQRPLYLCAGCYAQQLREQLAYYYQFSTQHLEDRFSTLLAVPDALEQWKGVCGFAACIHEIFKRKEQIRDFFEATFHDLAPKDYDPEFVLADTSRVRIPIAEWIGPPRTAFTAMYNKTFVDWCLCRALAYLLKVKNRSLYSREKKFSDHFEISDWKDEGNFAIQTDSLAFVARNILGLKVLWVLKHDYAPSIKITRESTPRLANATASIATGLSLAREAEFLLDGSVAMFTAIHTGHLIGNNPATESWTSLLTSDKFFDSRAETGQYTAVDKPDKLPFNHWVVINDAKLSSDKSQVTFSMWTWHLRRDITYPVKHLTKYIREAIFVKL